MNDPAQDLVSIAFSDTSGDEIRIRIPDALAAAWDVTANTVQVVSSTQNSGTKLISSVAFDSNDAIISFESTLIPRDTLVIRGLRLRDFSDISSGRLSAVFLSQGQPFDTVEAQNIIGIDQLRITSARNSIIIRGQDSTIQHPPVTVNTPTYPALNAGDTVYVRIPAGLNMVWDSSSTLVVPAGGQIQRIDGNKTLRIIIGSGGAPFNLANLYLSSFGNSGKGSLQIWSERAWGVNTAPNSVDDKTIVLALPSFAHTDTLLYPEESSKPVTLEYREDIVMPILNRGMQVTFVLPNTVDLQWLKGNETEQGKISDVQVQGKRATVSVTDSFDAGEGFSITGLLIVSPNYRSSRGSITLEIREGTAPPAELESDLPRFLRVVRPRASIGKNYKLIDNSPSVKMGYIAIAGDDSASGISGITANGDIIIKIPEELNLEWDTSKEPQFTSTKITSSRFADAKTLSLSVGTDFEQGEEVLIEGLYVNTILSSPARQLYYIFSGGDEADILDEHTITIGLPEISSRMNQVFLQNGPLPAGLLPIYLKDDPEYPVLMPDLLLKLSLPFSENYSLDDSSGISLGGDADYVELVDGDSIHDGYITHPDEEMPVQEIMLRVTKEFTASTLVSIGNLQFNRLSVNDTVSWHLTVIDTSLYGSTSYFNYRDPYTIKIGNVSFSSAANNDILILDSTANAQMITIKEDAAVAVLSDTLRIVITSALPLEWNQVTPDLNPAGDYLYLPRNGPFKELNIILAQPLGPGGELTIRNLKFTNMTEKGQDTLALYIAPAPRGNIANLMLKDQFATYILSPTFGSVGEQVFITGDDTTAMVPVQITEDDRRSTIRTGAFITLKIPDSLNCTWWDDARNQAIISPPNILNPVSTFPNGKEARLTATGTLDTNETITISGLRFSNFGEPSRGMISLKIGESAKEIADSLSKRIGNPQISLGQAYRFSLDTSIHKSLGSIFIEESEIDAGITKDNDIQIRIPDSLKTFVRWESVHGFAGSGVNKVDTSSISFQEDSSVVYIDVIDDFEPGDRLELTGARWNIYKTLQNPDKVNLPRLLPVSSNLRLIVNPLTMRETDSTDNEIELYLPFFFTQPRVWSRDNMYTIISWHVFPGYAKNDNDLSGNKFAIYKNANSAEFIKPSSSVQQDDQLPGMSDVPMVQCKLEFGEMLTTNEWYLKDDNTRLIARIAENTILVNSRVGDGHEAEEQYVSFGALLDPHQVKKNQLYFVNPNERDLKIFVASSSNKYFELLAFDQNRDTAYTSPTPILINDDSVSWSRSDIPSDSALYLVQFRLLSAANAPEGSFIIQRQVATDIVTPQITVEVGAKPIYTTSRLDDGNFDYVTSIPNRERPLTGQDLTGGDFILEYSPDDSIAITVTDNLSFAADDSILYYRGSNPQHAFFLVDLPFQPHIKGEIEIKDEDEINSRKDSTLVLQSADTGANRRLAFNPEMIRNLVEGMSGIVHVYIVIFDPAGNAVNVPVLHYRLTQKQDGTISRQFINFPNPFSSLMGNGTSFRYILLEPADAGEIIIFNANGELVDRIELTGDTNLLQTGEHLIRWNGKDSWGDPLASGVYFGVLNAGGATQKVKIVISN